MKFVTLQIKLDFSVADEIEIEDKTFLGELKKHIVSMSEIDQDCAVLDELFVEPSRIRALARIEEGIGHLMMMREKLKALKIEEYKDKKFRSLMKTKSKQ